jgi:hypothetical protein
VEPGIAAEHLVTALAGDHCRVILRDAAGKEHQRGIDVRHAGQPPERQGFPQRFHERMLREDHALMAGADVGRGLPGVGLVALRLKGAGGEVFLVALVIHRITGHRFEWRAAPKAPSAR